MIPGVATAARGLRRLGTRVFAWGEALVSDRHVELGCVEVRIALTQAALIGAPIAFIAVLFMAVLP